MNKRVEVLKSLFMSSFAALLIVFTACGGEGGSILDNLTSDATLKSVELTGVNLCPVFDQGTTNYSVEVPFATESLQLKYSAGTTAIVKIIANGKSVNISDNTATITIGNKTKVIIKITDRNNTSISKEYVIAINRLADGATSSNADLSSIGVSTGNLSPFFDPAQLTYDVEVDNSTASVKVRAVAAGVGAELSINEKIVASGSESEEISLVDGVATINIVVTAQDKSTTKTYTVTIQAIKADKSSNADLVRLIVSAGSLNPGFASGILNYTVELPAQTKSITITPTAASLKSTITVGGDPVTSGQESSVIALNSGDNVIPVVVTAEDGVTIKLYEIKAVVQTSGVSSDATLSALSISVGTLDPVFVTSTTSYQVIVPNTTESLTVTPTVSDENATVKINGNDVVSGQASNPIQLTVVGNAGNSVNIVVTAADKVTQGIYTVKVIRLKENASSNADLQNLAVSGLTLAFNPATTDYTTSVANSVSSVSVTPTVADSGAGVTVEGTAVTSGSPSSTIDLNVGTNEINIVVTAADSLTTKEYRVTIIRQEATVDPNANADLSELNLRKFTGLIPTLKGNVEFEFNPAVTDYSVTVTKTYLETYIKVDVVATAAEEDATVTIEPDSRQPLSSTDGQNTATFTITVTAPDGMHQKIYTITAVKGW